MSSPSETLAQLHWALSEAADVVSHPEPLAHPEAWLNLATTVRDARDLFMDLHEHLSRGGLLPIDWQDARRELV